MHDDIVEFLTTHQEHFQRFDEEYTENNTFGKNFPTPRSWIEFNKSYAVFKHMEDPLLYEHAQGHFGTNVAQAFVAFIKVHSKKLPDVATFFKENQNKIEKSYIEWMKKEKEIRIWTFNTRIINFLIKEVKELKSSVKSKDKEKKLQEYAKTIEYYIEALALSTDSASTEKATTFYRELNSTAKDVDDFGDKLFDLINLDKNNNLKPFAKKFVEKLEKYSV